MKLGPYIVLRIDEEPFYNHFKRFWANMPEDMKDAARMAAIHLKYRPGMRPQAVPHNETFAMNTEGVEVTG